MSESIGEAVAPVARTLSLGPASPAGGKGKPILTSRCLAVIQPACSGSSSSLTCPPRARSRRLPCHTRGDKLFLADGTPCNVICVGPPPEDSHLIKGIVYATASG